MGTYLEGFTPYDPQDAARYDHLRWWPGLTLGDLLDKAADIYPDREGFVDGRGRLTFGQARDEADRLAVGLMELGLRPRDRVLIQLPNWNEFPVAYFALQKIGAIPVLLIDRHRQHEINHLVRLTGAVGWIAPGRYRDVAFAPIIREVRDANPGLETIVLARGDAAAPYPTLASLATRPPLSAVERERLAARRPDPMEVAHLAPTGGTTGLPKVVPRTHNSLVCGAEYAARAWDYTGEDTCLLAGPIGHDLTFTKGFLGGVFLYARLVFLDSTGLASVCQTIQDERVTAVVWVPTLANRLLRFEHRADYDLSSLKKMHSGGAASLPDLIRGVREDLDCAYYNGYGGTEGQTTITRTGDDLETVCTSVGKPTCPYDRYRVIGPNGEDLPRGTPGELVIKGPGVFTGYYRSPEENARAFTADGFFRTGDLARIDERGYVTLTGRAKEMINRGGESISSAEIERLISAHPDVVAVAVVPMPDPDLGERACAYVQTRPGVSLTFQDVIDFLKSRKAAVLHLPERIEFRDELPHTKTGKLDKSALTDDIRGRVAP